MDKISKAILEGAEQCFRERYSINITQERFDSAKQCLIDNGIDVDESEIVLQALCYILCNQETEQFFADEG